MRAVPETYASLGCSVRSGFPAENSSKLATTLSGASSPVSACVSANLVGGMRASKKGDGTSQLDLKTDLREAARSMRNVHKLGHGIEVTDGSQLLRGRWRNIIRTVFALKKKPLIIVIPSRAALTLTGCCAHRNSFWQNPCQVVVAHRPLAQRTLAAVGAVGRGRTGGLEVFVDAGSAKNVQAPGQTRLHRHALANCAVQARATRRTASHVVRPGQTIVFKRGGRG